MLKLVVFDCDGVMFSSKESNRAFYNHILAHFGHPAMDADELEYAHIHNVKDSITHLFRHYDTPISEVNRFRESLDYTPYLHYMEMEPDLIDFLQTIKPRVHIAISTNRMDTMDTILDTFHIRPWFDMVVTASNAPRPKPAPDGLQMILDRFSVLPEETIYIGDSVIDQEHCASVGVDLIAFRNPELQARFWVDSFMEILELAPFQQD
nr:HAD family hydrolase [uncultured Desulfobulbus sp.]